MSLLFSPKGNTDWCGIDNAQVLTLLSKTKVVGIKVYKSSGNKQRFSSTISMTFHHKKSKQFFAYKKGEKKLTTRRKTYTNREATHTLHTFTPPYINTSFFTNSAFTSHFSLPSLPSIPLSYFSHCSLAPSKKKFVTAVTNFHNQTFIFNDQPSSSISIISELHNKPSNPHHLHQPPRYIIGKQHRHGMIFNLEISSSPSVQEWHQFWLSRIQRRVFLVYFSENCG